MKKTREFRSVSAMKVLLLLLLMMMMMTTMVKSQPDSDSSEDVQQQLPERLRSDDSGLDDMKKFKIALTPPPNSLPADVAQKAAEGEAEAEAVRQEEAKTKKKLWQKAMETANKDKPAKLPAADTNVDQQHPVEGEENQRKMEHEEEHGRGEEKHQQPSAVNRHIVILNVLTQMMLNCSLRRLLDRFRRLYEKILI